MNIETEEGGGEELSIRDSLSQAFEADRGGDEGGSTVTPVTPKPEPAAQATTETAAAPRADGRDAQGRFAPKTDIQTQTPAAPEAQPTPTGQAEPIQPPASWSAPAKAAFAALPPIVQGEIAKREADVNRGFEERAAALKRYEPIEQLLAPRRDQLAARGVDEATFLKTLFAASDWLDRDPVSAMRELMRQYGVHPQHLGAQPTGQQPQPAAQQHPAISALAQQVQSLQTQLSQRTQAEQAQRQNAVLSEIQAFSNDPANVYFENVREDMIGLLHSGRAKDLKGAYDMAVWANPETRALLQADAAKKAEAERLSAQRQQTNGARRAAGSVTGSPSPGASPPAVPVNPNATVRDDLKAAIAAHRV